MGRVGWALLWEVDLVLILKVLSACDTDEMQYTKSLT
jgi:hypothetical protein